MPDYAHSKRYIRYVDALPDPAPTRHQPGTNRAPVVPGPTLPGKTALSVCFRISKYQDRLSDDSYAKSDDCIQYFKALPDPAPTRHQWCRVRHCREKLHYPPVLKAQTSKNVFPTMTTQRQTIVCGIPMRCRTRHQPWCRVGTGHHPVPGTRQCRPGITRHHKSYI